MNIELDEKGCEELYFLLSHNETSLSGQLYSLMIQLEKPVFKKYSIEELRALKAEARRKYSRI